MAVPVELLKGSAMTLILACLAVSPMHGYALAKFLRQHSDGYLDISEGALYPHLHTLEKNGLIEGSWQSVGSERERKVYRLSQKGREVLAEKIEIWNRFQSKVSDILNMSL